METVLSAQKAIESLMAFFGGSALTLHLRAELSRGSGDTGRDRGPIPSQIVRTQTPTPFPLGLKHEIRSTAMDLKLTAFL